MSLSEIATDRCSTNPQILRYVAVAVALLLESQNLLQQLWASFAAPAGPSPTLGYLAAPAALPSLRGAESCGGDVLPRPASNRAGHRLDL